MSKITHSFLECIIDQHHIIGLHHIIQYYSTESILHSIAVLLNHIIQYCQNYSMTWLQCCYLVTFNISHCNRPTSCYLVTQHHVIQYSIINWINTTHCYSAAKSHYSIDYCQSILEYDMITVLPGNILHIKKAENVRTSVAQVLDKIK